jgi:hypothetical protein
MARQEVETWRHTEFNRRHASHSGMTGVCTRGTLITMTVQVSVSSTTAAPTKEPHSSFPMPAIVKGRHIKEIPRKGFMNAHDVFYD